MKIWTHKVINQPVYKRAPFLWFLKNMCSSNSISHYFHSRNALYTFSGTLEQSVQWLKVKCQWLYPRVFKKIYHMSDLFPRDHILRKLSVYIFIFFLLCQNIETHGEDIWHISIECAHPWPVWLWSCASEQIITYQLWSWNMSFANHRTLFLFRCPACSSSAFPISSI